MLQEETTKHYLTEEYLFTLPNQLDLVIAAIIAIKALVFVQCKKDALVRKIIHLPGMPECMRFLSTWLENDRVSVVYDATVDPDLEFAFDGHRAHAFSFAVEKHAVQSFSILIGTTTSTILPSKTTIESSFPVDDEYETIVLTSDYYEADLVRDMLLENTNNAPVCVFEVTEDWLNPAIVSKIRGCKTLVGERSAYTYLAAALDKRVVELYPNDVHRNWLSKWDSPNYRMVYLDGVDYVAPHTIWRVLEHNKWASMV